jgi:hypothetical protein
MTTWELVKERIARRFEVHGHDSDSIGFEAFEERILLRRSEHGWELTTSICAEQSANMWGVVVDETQRLVIRGGYYFLRQMLSINELDIEVAARRVVETARRVRREAARPMFAPVSALFNHLSD